MLISTKMNLPLQERFNLFIKERIANCYISSNGDLINVFSSFESINKELLNKGIDYRDKSIDDLILEIEKLSILKARESFENLNIEEWKKAEGEVWESNGTESEQLNVLKDCILELAFYMHDYQYDNMPLSLKREFKNIRQYSNLLRKHKFNF